MSLNNRYDWYQTETLLVLSFLVKNVSKENVFVEINDDEINMSVTIKTAADTELYWPFILHGRVEKDNYIVKTTPSKVEVKLKKIDGPAQWRRLERDRSGAEPAIMAHPSATQPQNTGDQSSGASGFGRKDWNKIEKDCEEELDKEKKEGEGAINEFFQDLFARGDPDTQRAMMKSFYESGGTVLSTNWNEVGKAKVDVKPPDGLEHRTWDT